MIIFVKIVLNKKNRNSNIQKQIKLFNEELNIDSDFSFDLCFREQKIGNYIFYIHEAIKLATKCLENYYLI